MFIQNRCDPGSGLSRLFFAGICVINCLFSDARLNVHQYNVLSDRRSTMIETKIYVGLNDSETMKQEHDTIKYISILKNVCKSYKVPFSFSLAQGGYIHEDGRYTEELTLVISMIDISGITINEIARDLCVFFRQESVMITKGKIISYFINQPADLQHLKEETELNS